MTNVIFLHFPYMYSAQFCIIINASYTQLIEIIIIIIIIMGRDGRTLNNGYAFVAQSSTNSGGFTTTRDGSEIEGRIEPQNRESTSIPRHFPISTAPGPVAAFFSVAIASIVVIVCSVGNDRQTGGASWPCGPLWEDIQLHWRHWRSSID